MLPGRQHPKAGQDGEGLALPLANHLKSGLLDIAPNRSIYLSRIQNTRLQMEPAQQQRWCLQTM